MTIDKVSEKTMDTTNRKMVNFFAATWRLGKKNTKKNEDYGKQMESMNMDMQELKKDLCYVKEVKIKNCNENEFKEKLQKMEDDLALQVEQMKAGLAETLASLRHQAEDEERKMQEETDGKLNEKVSRDDFAKPGRIVFKLEEDVQEFVNLKVESLKISHHDAFQRLEKELSEKLAKSISKLNRESTNDATKNLISQKEAIRRVEKQVNLQSKDIEQTLLEKLSLNSVDPVDGSVLKSDDTERKFVIKVHDCFEKLREAMSE